MYEGLGQSYSMRVWGRVIVYEGLGQSYSMRVWGRVIVYMYEGLGTQPYIAAHGDVCICWTILIIN